LFSKLRLGQTRLDNFKLCLNFTENKKKTYLKKNGLVPIGGKGAKFQPIQKKLLVNDKSLCIHMFTLATQHTHTHTIYIYIYINLG
jgi:hypothetical protein